MPARLPLILALALAVAAAAWLVFGESGGRGSGAADVDVHGAAESADGAGRSGDPSLRADGTPRPSGTPDAPRATAAGPTPVGTPTPGAVRRTLRGILRGRDGRPLGVQRLRLTDAAGNRFTVTTDTDGSFSFEGTPGRYVVHQLGGSDVARLGELVLDGASAQTPKPLELGLQGSLRVRLQSMTGPRAGVPVHVIRVDTGDVAVEPLRSDADGLATFGPLDAGRYEVRAVTDDDVTYQKQAQVWGTATTDVAMLLVPTRPIVGAVTLGKDGPGVSRARVRMVVHVERTQPPVIHEWTTDYAGTFALDVPRGMVMQVVVRADDAAPLFRSPRELAPAFLAAFARNDTAPARLDLVMARGVAVRGTVRTPEAEPVGDVTLQLLRPDDELLMETRVEPDGTFRFGHVPPGMYRVAVDSPAWTIGGQYLAVSAQDDGRERTLTVTPRRSLRGTVYGADGAPVAGARVWVLHGETVVGETFSDARGWWRIDALPVFGGGLTLLASSGDLRAPPIWLGGRAGDRPQALTLAPAGILRGTLRDAVSEAPIAGARILATWPSVIPNETAVFTTTDAEGGYELRALVPGTWHVVPRAPGYVDFRTQRVEVTADAPAQADLVLTPGITLAGSVADADDRPLSGVEVHAVWQGPASQPTHMGRDLVFTAPDGRFEITGLPPGTYEVRATRRDVAAGILRTAATVGGERTDLRLVFGATGDRK